MSTISFRLPGRSRYFGTSSPSSFDTTDFVPRRHDRVALRTLLKIFSRNGEVERALTRNLSRGGLSFASSKPHSLGDEFMLELQAQELGLLIRGRAKVVYRLGKKGAGLCVYGVQYLS